jgi:hypothetical protein
LIALGNSSHGKAAHKDIINCADTKKNNNKQANRAKKRKKEKLDPNPIKKKRRVRSDKKSARKDTLIAPSENPQKNGSNDNSFPLESDETGTTTVENETSTLDYYAAFEEYNSNLENNSSGEKKERRSKLPLRSILRLRAFFSANVHNPYPTDEQKAQLAIESNLTVKQISNWFTNTRRRFWQPYMKKVQRAAQSISNTPAFISTRSRRRNVTTNGNH